ncbi:unnamed protein product [Amoebophrya sp. A25]|nr:unnamed protein product [Amoebophrya sp. A25]|eukprot:GSA25T00023389001.1
MLSGPFRHKEVPYRGDRMAWIPRYSNKFTTEDSVSLEHTASEASSRSL